MAVKTYMVVKCGEEWRVLTRERTIGHYKHQEFATALAVNLAREAINAGHQVDFFVQTPDGEMAPQEPRFCFSP
jgi:hypothetical protein